MHIGRKLIAPTLVAFDSHLLEGQDVGVRQHLEQLDLAQGGDGKAILLVVYQDLFEGDNGAGSFGAGLGDDTEGTLTQFLNNVKVVDASAPAESALARIRHGHFVRASVDCHGMRRARACRRLVTEGACVLVERWMRVRKAGAKRGRRWANQAE